MKGVFFEEHPLYVFNRIKLMRYRPDIDGLRAVAVLLVLAFHGGLSNFSSGFIGVDIFFVISGYLITSIVIHDIEKKSFSLANFYVRRIWRLQPAFLAMLLSTFVIASIFYLPDDFINYLRSAYRATIFVSNQFFLRTTTQYAAPDAASQLLLHTWSLAIEWQWYFFMPFLTMIACRFLTRNKLKFLCVTLLFTSIGVAYIQSVKYPNHSYYFFAGRIFEFLIGASVFIFQKEREKIPDFLQNIISLLSVSAIALCVNVKDIVFGYPDYHALIISIASGLLILMGSNHRNWISKVLSLKPIVYVGMLSYSLYLWHWPVFAAGRYLGLAENNYFKVSCFAITFIAAYLSYSFIEKPCRKIRWTLRKSLLILVIIPIAIFSVSRSVSEKYKGFGIRFGSEYARVESTLHKYASPYRKYCIDGNTDGKDKNCVVGDINSGKRALLIGDSFSNQYWDFIDVLAKDANMSVSVQGTSSCLTLPGIYQYDWWYFKNTVYQECHDNTKKYYEHIEKGKFNYVIIGEVWMNYAGDNIINNIGDKRSISLSRERIEVAMKKALKIIVKSGARPVIIKTIYTMPHNYMDCFYQHIKLRQDYIPNSCNPNLWRGDKNEWFTQLFNKLEKEYPSMIVIDPKNVQCVGDVCKTDLNGVPVYRDVGHITDYASYIFGKEYLKKFPNPFK